MKLIESLNQWWEAYKHQRYLKKMGWTEEAFKRRTDPRVVYQAQTVRQFYQGYLYTHIYDDCQSGPFLSKNWTDVYVEIDAWCRDNLIGAWRDDIHRVYEQHGIGVDGTVTTELFINDIGPYDVLVYAFENERDYFMFALRWS